MATIIYVICSFFITLLIIINSILNGKNRKEAEKGKIQKPDNSAAKIIKAKYKQF